MHFHMLFLDGVYLADGADPPVFRVVSAPDPRDLQALIERDIENAWLSAGAEPGPLDDLIGHSSTYRIAYLSRAEVDHREPFLARRRRKPQVEGDELQ